MYGQFNPYQSIMPQMASQSLIRVNGIDGAKAYQMGANSQVALFDANDDLFYVKCTDGAGFPTIRVFRFEETHENAPKTHECDYVSREEMEEYVKHIIQEQSAGKPKATNKSTADADSK